MAGSQGLELVHSFGIGLLGQLWQSFCGTRNLGLQEANVSPAKVIVTFSRSFAETTDSSRRCCG